MAVLFPGDVGNLMPGAEAPGKAVYPPASVLGGQVAHGR